MIFENIESAKGSRGRCKSNKDLSLVVFIICEDIHPDRSAWGDYVKQKQGKYRISLLLTTFTGKKELVAAIRTKHDVKSMIRD